MKDWQSLLTMIDWLTCYNDVPWNHSPKMKLESWHSLPVKYETRLPRTKGSILTNCCHETIYHWIYASSISLTHWYQYHQILPPTIWWQQTCALDCLFAIWSIINLFCSFEGIGVLLTSWWTFNLQVFIIPYECHLPPCQPIAISFYYADAQSEQNAYPEMWKFWKNYDDDITPFQLFMFQNMPDHCQC